MSKAVAAVRTRALPGPDSGPRLESLVPSPGAARERRPVPGELVSRPHLVSRLVEAHAPVVLVAAPAGYGKTTLVAEWGRCDPRPFAWVTAESDGGTGTSLVAAVEQALDDVAPVGSRKRSVSTRSSRSPAAVALARLVRSLDSRPAFVLVLDDLQLAGGSTSLEAVRTLVRHVPPGSRLVLCSRTEPALPIGRLRANRALTEIRPRDLVMTVPEAATLLRRSGVPLARTEVEELGGKAEGWPAGLYLAAVALRGQPDMHAAVARFGGDDAIVADYLRDEVLAHLEPEAVTFLRRSSILDRLSGPLCDAVLERSDSARLLDSIGGADLLLVPLDRSQESYRCHGLLATMLRAELRRVEPRKEARLHRRASDWYAGRGDVDRAMHHAVAAGDTGRAAGLLGARAPGYVTQRGNGAVERWLSSFTDEQIAARPALALAAANSHLLKGELDAVERWESAARRTLHETPPGDRPAALRACVAILQAAVARQGVRHMGEDATRAYELEPEDSPWRAICCLLAGVSRHLTGDPDGAEISLEEGVRRGAVAAPNIQTLCLAQLALVAADRDEWEIAAAFATRAMAQVEHYALSEYPTSALVFATSAAVQARRGRVEQAQAHSREARRLLGRLTDFIPWYEVETRVALASAALRLSDIAGARELLSTAARLVRRMPDAAVLHDSVARVEARIDAAPASPALLTTAELRILAFLPTHLSFREIAGRLYVSANTVKTQAHAVYRKLGAASRSEAVSRAAQLGLVDF